MIIPKKMNKSSVINTLIRVFLLFSINTFLAGNAHSQQIESPISPYQVIVHDWEIGFFVGLGANFNTGSYAAECPECIFDDVSKFGFTAGLKTDYQLSKHFYIGASLAYEDLSVKGAFRRIESVALDRVDGTKIYVPIEFRHSSQFDIGTLSIMPNITYRIDRFLDFRLGFFSDFAFNSNFIHSKELLTKSVILPDGEKVSVEIPQQKGNVVELENRSIPNISTPIFGIYPQINFNIELAGTTDMNIGFTYKLPLTNLTSKQDFKINSWRIMIGFAFDMYDDTKEFGEF